MSYDLLILRQEKGSETIEEIPNELIISALNENPYTQKDEDGFWEYERDGVGFAISFDDEEAASDHVMVHFSYSSPKPELIYRMAAGFSIGLAERLGAKAADPQMDEYLSSENMEDGIKCCLESFQMFEEHAMRRVQEGEHIIIGPRRAVLRSMYRQGAKSRRKAGFKIWHIVIIVAIALAVMLLARLIRTGTFYL